MTALLTIDPVAFHIFGWPVRWYGLIIAFGIFLAYFLCQYELKRKNFDEEFLSDLLLWVIPIGFIGARIYYVLFQLPYYMAHPAEIIKIWEGGIAIYGGVIAGAITLYVYCERKFMNPYFMADVIAPNLLLAQSIGRWGNFINQEAHGGVVSEAFLRNSLHLPDFIVKQMHMEGQFYHPTFLYESLWNLLGVVIIYVLRARDKSLKVGETTLLYFIWYGIGRFFIEGLRTDSLMFGVVRISQLLSAVFVLMAVGLFLYSHRQMSRPYYSEYQATAFLRRSAHAKKGI